MTVRLHELADADVDLTVFLGIADPRSRAELKWIRSADTQAVKESIDEADIERPFPFRELTGRVGSWDASATESP